jgi:hypothetical protein
VCEQVYPGDGDAVGSVGWVPGSPNSASVTTDGGKLHIFDIRTEVSAAVL